MLNIESDGIIKHPIEHLFIMMTPGVSLCKKLLDTNGTFQYN
jgi:hypothetical protein